MNTPRQPDYCEPLIDDKQAAVILGVCKKTVQRKAISGEIPAFKIGNSWRFRASLLDEWIQAQMQRGAGK